MVDAVNTIASVALFTDSWEIDVAYTVSHHTLCGPVGLIPITFGSRALAKMARRKSPMKSCYWNVKVLADNWSRAGTGELKKKQYLTIS